MTNSEQNIIIGRRKIDLESQKDTVRYGDLLPAEYNQVIEDLTAHSASKSFTEQAKQVVYYFYALDNNKSLEDSNGTKIDLDKFAEEIASLPLVKLLYVKSSRNDSSPVPKPTNGMVVSWRTISLGDPETSFPSWVKTHVKLGEVDRDYSDLERFYTEWKNKKALTEYKGDHGTYAVYPDEIVPPKSDKADGLFKGYVEKNTSPEQLEKAFEELAQLKIHPHETKFFDRVRMVLYWSSEANDALLEKIKSIFEKHDVPFRGPGQDSVFLLRNEKGEIKTEVRVSNDQARGEGGNSLDFDQEQFDPIFFLKTYLQQCYRYWRNPINPYTLSFVPAFDKSGGDVSDLKVLQNRVSRELVVQDGWVLKLFKDLKR